MSDWLFDYLKALEGDKHLSGEHDQSTHGHGHSGGGGGSGPSRARTEFKIPKGYTQDGKVGKYKTGSFAIITRETGDNAGKFGHIVDYGFGDSPVITLPLFNDRPSAVDSAKIAIDKHLSKRGKN